MDLGEPQRRYHVEPRELPIPIAVPVDPLPVPEPEPVLEPAEAT